MKIVMGVTNLAKELQVTPKTIYNYIEEGMPCEKIKENKHAFNFDEVWEWMKNRTKKLKGE